MKLVMTNRCVKNPRHLSFPCDECSWDHIDDTSGTLLNNTLVEKAKAEEISVIRELGVWEVIDRPYDEVVFGTRWVDINKGDETTPFYRSRSCKSMSVKQTGHFSQLHVRSSICEGCSFVQRLTSFPTKWYSQLPGQSLLS